VENVMSDALECLHSNERRLAAILAADVAGYSRLMGRNEEETVRGTKVMRGLLVVLALMLAVTTAAAGDPLFDAVAAGDRAAVEQALANGASVDSRASDQATPLMAAALANQTVIVEALLGKGANVMARNSGGFTPLHAAAYAGSVPITKLLLDRGAVLDDADNKAGVTPLMVAGEENHLELAEFLLAKGADVNHPEIHGYLPITRAIFKGNKDIVRLYKSHGVTCPSVKILGSEEWYRQCDEIGQ
jgi:ankyrin repeat protein